MDTAQTYAELIIWAMGIFTAFLFNLILKRKENPE